MVISAVALTDRGRSVEVVMDDPRLRQLRKALASMGLVDIRPWSALGEGMYLAHDPRTGIGFYFSTGWSVVKIRQLLRAHRARYGIPKYPKG